MTSIRGSVQQSVQFQARFKMNQAKVDNASFALGTTGGAQVAAGTGMSCASDPQAAQFANMAVQSTQLSGAPEMAQIIQQNPSGVGFLSTISAATSGAGTIYLQNVVKPRVPEHIDDIPSPKH